MSFTHKFDSPKYKGEIKVNTGVFINNEWSEGSDKTEIEVINPTNGKVLTKVSEGTAKDVDRAVEAAQKAFETTWGLNASGAQRRDCLAKLGELMSQHHDELSALEALDNGKTFTWASNVDVTFSTQTIKYYAGWADKIQGKVIETNEAKFGYTRHEPIGVVGQIIPWNFPLLMFVWKIGPALATGNTIVIKPSELTPLTALRMADLIVEAGFPPGVVNIITGYGQTVGQAIAEHMKIEKVAFTGSTLVGRKVMESAAKSNLKNVTLELGGKGPSIIYDDADIDQAVKWAVHGVVWNHGQTCCAGTRVFVQETVYDKFLDAFIKHVENTKVGDPFGDDIDQGPQVSQLQYDRIMGYIESGKEEGAKLATGGGRHGEEGFFIQPTIFTDVRDDMKIVKEEIFGPVGVVIPFKDQEDVLKKANDTVYGLAASVFSENIKRALDTAHKLKAGTAWVNCANTLDAALPFGGYKQSGIGRELGEYALENYTSVKSVHVNLGNRL